MQADGNRAQRATSSALLGAGGVALLAVTRPAGRLPALAHVASWLQATPVDTALLTTTWLLGWATIAWLTAIAFLAAAAALPGGLGALSRSLLRLIAPRAVRRAAIVSSRSASSPAKAKPTFCGIVLTTRRDSFPEYIPFAIADTLCILPVLKKFWKQTMSTEETKDPSAPETSGATDTAAESASLTPEQIDELKTAAAKGAEHYDRYLRTVADFENFKKRATRERQEAIKFANESMLQKLIPVIDNFDMALLAANQTQEVAADSLTTGVNMIYSQLKAALNEFGLEEIDATGKKLR